MSQHVPLVNTSAAGQGAGLLDQIVQVLQKYFEGNRYEGSRNTLEGRLSLTHEKEQKEELLT